SFLSLRIARDGTIAAVFLRVTLVGFASYASLFRTRSCYESPRPKLRTDEQFRLGRSLYPLRSVSKNELSRKPVPRLQCSFHVSRECITSMFAGKTDLVFISFAEFRAPPHDVSTIGEAIGSLLLVSTDHPRVPSGSTSSAAIAPKHVHHRTLRTRAKLNRRFAPFLKQVRLR